jgi:glycosyltransferase involved in cell wall biosynthesis
LRILHITASYKPAFIYGGPIYSVAALCEELERSVVGSQKSAVGITVYTTLANGKEELPYRNGEIKMVDGISVQYFKRLTKDHSHLTPALLSHLWRNAKQFDVIHIHAWWNLVSMGAVLICLLRGVKPIVSPRGMLGDYTFTTGKKLFHRLIGKFFLRKCYFHATTPMEAEEIAVQVFDGKVTVVDLMEGDEKKQESRNKNQEKKAQIFVIHNIVKLPAQLPKKTRIFDGTLKLIFLSRIHHKKGIELLLDALATVDFPFQLSIVGEGEEEYVEGLKRKVESLGLSKAVYWIGAVYGEEKYQLLANHDAFILPSYNENFANVVIEAIAVNTPVLLSEHVGLKDYIEDNKVGLAFKLDEIKLILEKIQSLLLANQSAFYFKKQMISDDLTLKYLEMYQSQLKH